MKASSFAALVAFGASQLWCASNDPTSSPEDGGATDSAPADASPYRDSATVTPCTESFCRIAFPTTEVVALDGLWAKNASDVWVVGSSGYAAHFDGDTWKYVSTGTKATLFAVTGSGDGTVWGASTGGAFLMLNRPSANGVLGTDGGFGGIVTAIAAFGATDTYAVGIVADPFVGPADNIWRYRRESSAEDPRWHPVSPPCPIGDFAPACVALRAIWVESSERQWFAGDDGRLYRTITSDGERLGLTEMNSSSLRRLNALWGFSGNDVWAVGAQGVIRHFAGGDAFAVVPSPVTAELRGVWGSRSDDVWAVGDDGVVVHWDGQTWTLVETPFGDENRPRLYAVAGTGDDVWIAGENTLLRSTSHAAGGDR